MSDMEAMDPGPPQTAGLRRKAEQRLQTTEGNLGPSPSDADVRALVHELQVHQVELEMQNDELQRAQAAAEEASERYGDLFDFAPVAYFLWDHEGRILEVNLAGGALLSRDRGMVVYKRFEQFVAAEYRAGFADFLARVLATDAKQTCEVKLLKDGQTINALVEGIAAQVRPGQEKVCRAAVIDVSQQKRANELAAANEALQYEIAAHEQAEEALRSLAQFPDENPFPVLRIDRAGTVLYANASSAALCGQSRCEVGSAAPEPLVRHVRETLDSEQPDQLDLESGGRVFSFLFAPVAGSGYVNLYGRDITQRKWEEKEREIATGFLRLVNESRGKRDLIRAAATFFQEQSGCEAVGIRLKEDEDYPYYETRGFPQEFVLLENQLCARDSAGVVVRDSAGSPVCDCMCGNVIRGRFDPSQPFFTARGSFWTNSTSELLASTTEADPQARTRNRCNGEGYESVALIALLSGEDRWGLLQLNDRRKGRFTAEGIALWERLAGYLAVALAKTMAEEALRESEERYRTLFDTMTEGFALHEIITDDQGRPCDYRFLNVNASFERLTGLKRGDLLGKTVREVMPATESHWIETYGKVALTGEPMHLQNFAASLNRWYEAFAYRTSPGRFAVIFSDVTERKRQEERLRENEQQFRTLAESIPNLAWWANGDGYLTWYNRRWYEYTGTTAQQMEGWGWQSVHDPHELPRVLQRWQASIASGEPFETEFPLRGRDGQFRWFLTRVLPLKDAGGRVVRWFGTNTDVTEVRQARQAAEAANVAKSQFLASMSHELRTPMNAILGMTDLALGEQLPATIRDYLQTVKESADLLLELLNEILDFSRIEAGRFELESAPFTLRKAVEQVIKTLGIRAYEKDLELACQVADELPRTVVGDPLRLRQVLLNLVSNAIKFTSKGEVVVRVAVEQRTAEAVSLRFSVSDTGIGIAPEKWESIFAPFTQADSSTTRRFGGTGLGLAISQRLVNMMGGQIRVHSRPGKGSTFFFTLTLPIAEHADDDGEAAPAGQDLLHGLRALVIGVSATSRKILQRTLAGWRMQVDEAPEVTSGLAKIHEAAAEGRAYRVVLADAIMPGIDGFTLVEWLEQDPRLAGSVILMLSATDRQTYPEQCRKVATACLEKPVSRPALFGAIAKAIGADGAVAPTDGGHPAVSPAVPRRILRVLVAEDTPANQKLVRHVLGSRGHKIQIVENGRQALERIEAAGFRPGADGRADARDGRLPGDRGHPQAERREEGPLADHRHDGPCAAGRSGALPGGGHGRLSQQAGAGRGIDRIGRTAGRQRRGERSGRLRSRRGD